MLKRMDAIIALAVMTVCITACNTFEGIGKDTSAAGDNIAKAARDVKHEITK